MTALETLKFSIPIYSFSIRSLCKLLYARATLQLRGTIFGSLGRHWGHFLGSWGALGGSWGGLGVGLGGLGVLLGGSWGGLGRSWDDLGATFGAVQFSIDFLFVFGRQKGPHMEAF